MSKVENPYVSPPPVDAEGSNRMRLLIASGLAWLLVTVGSLFLQAWIMPLHGLYEPAGPNIAGYLFPFNLPIISAIIGVGFNFAIVRARREPSRVTHYAMSLLLALVVTSVTFSALTFPLVSLMYGLA